MKISLLLISTLLLSNCSTEQWYAMGRHGGCYDLAEFSKSDALITGAKSPAEIESKLKKAGIEYTLTKNKDLDGMIILNVPSKNWGMTFVLKKYCKEFVELPK